MNIDKNVAVAEIACVGFDFEKCNKKEILSKMLENLTPTSVEKFESEGTQWNLLGEYYAEFDCILMGLCLEQVI